MESIPVLHPEAHQHWWKEDKNPCVALEYALSLGTTFQFISAEREQSAWQALEMNEDTGPKALGMRF